MTSECPLCNTDSVIEEEENGQIHHVCMECGHILQERAILAAEAPQEVIIRILIRGGGQGGG